MSPKDVFLTFKIIKNMLLFNAKISVKINFTEKYI